MDITGKLSNRMMGEKWDMTQQSENRGNNILEEEAPKSVVTSFWSS